MKYFTRFIFFVFIVFLTSLTSCRTMRTSEKAVSESETASVTASRLTFYRTIDSLSRQLNFSADSLSIIFLNTSEQEFPTAFPSGIEGCTETPSDSLANKGTPKVRQRLRNASRSKAASRPAQVPSYLQRPSGPLALKIYGLHVNASSDKKSVEQADLKDSVAVATQSDKHKSATKQSSDPIKAPKWIFLCLVAILLLYILYKIRR
jgi:hypothetical protein